MKLMVVGGGGREHAIIKKLKESPEAEIIYALPGNGGIAADAVCVPEIGAVDIKAIVQFAREKEIDFAVIAPDDPLVMGAVDALEAIGVPCFGPRREAAMIEGSKVFAKNLMKKYGIPTAAYEVFDDMDRALAYLETAPMPIVIKAEGLALGKGVIIAQNLDEARGAVKTIMGDKKFGAAGDQIVIEEFLTGPEVSVLSFTDGAVVVPMVSSMDHKRAFDGDRGPNTGGMGAVAPNPYYTPAVAKRCMEEIFLPTLHAMNAEGRTFRGCLYFGLMITRDGPKVIEYNCRFGDPETQVVLQLLKTDLLTVMQAVSQGTLAGLDLEWSNEAAACVILASQGYPGAYEKGRPITLPESLPDNVVIYHAGDKLSGDGKLVTSGGRVLGITASAPTLTEALGDAYEAAAGTDFEGKQFRSDIGILALAAKGGR